jgi:hypothetical protein
MFRPLFIAESALKMIINVVFYFITFCHTFSFSLSLGSRLSKYTVGEGNNRHSQHHWVAQKKLLQQDKWWWKKYH